MILKNVGENISTKNEDFVRGLGTRKDTRQNKGEIQSCINYYGINYESHYETMRVIEQRRG